MQPSSIIMSRRTFAFATMVILTLPSFRLEGRSQVEIVWQQTNGPYGGDIRALAVDTADHLFAGSDGGVFRSTDGGANWTAINKGLTNHLVLSLGQNRSGMMFVGTAGDGVFRSTDSGANWAAVSNGLSNKTVLSLAGIRPGEILAGTDGGGVFRSTDNGLSWTPAITGLTSRFVQTLAAKSSSELFAGTSGGGVFRST